MTEPATWESEIRQAICRAFRHNENNKGKMFDPNLINAILQEISEARLAINLDWGAEEKSEDSAVDPCDDIVEGKSLMRGIMDLINYHSRENESNTPDFILAEYLMEVLESWERFTKTRDAWWNNKSLRR